MANRRPTTPLELDPPAYVVLGMLRPGARSGYDIKRLVDVSIRHFWTISHAQIYPSLERLEAAGLVRGRAEPQGRRPRRLYELTATGEDALAAWVRRPEPLTFELRDAGLLKLFFADAVEHDDARSLLHAVRERSAERVAGLQGVEEQAAATERDGDLYPRLTLRMGIAFHQAMIDVCDEFERELAGAGAR